MKSTMKAAVINEHSKDLEIKEVPIPELEYGEILVKTEAAGVCHTDLHAKIGDWPVKPKLPLNWRLACKTEITFNPRS